MTTKTKTKKRSGRGPKSGVLRAVKEGATVWLPLSRAMMGRLGATAAPAALAGTTQHTMRLHWTFVDGVLQLSMGKPSMAIPVLRDPVMSFGDTEGRVTDGD